MSPCSYYTIVYSQATHGSSKIPAPFKHLVPNINL